MIMVRFDLWLCEVKNNNYYTFTSTSYCCLLLVRYTNALMTNPIHRDRGSVPLAVLILVRQIHRGTDDATNVEHYGTAVPP